MSGYLLFMQYRIRPTKCHKRYELSNNAATVQRFN